MNGHYANGYYWAREKLSRCDPEIVYYLWRPEQGIDAVARIFKDDFEPIGKWDILEPVEPMAVRRESWLVKQITLLYWNLFPRRKTLCQLKRR